MTTTRVAGALAPSVSALLLVVVLVRDVGLNPSNGWTIVLGFAAGVLLLRASTNSALVTACVVLLVGMAPALIGGLGLLYVPSLVLAADAVLRGASPPHTT